MSSTPSLRTTTPTSSTTPLTPQTTMTTTTSSASPTNPNPTSPPPPAPPAVAAATPSSSNPTTPAPTSSSMPIPTPIPTTTTTTTAETPSTTRPFEFPREYNFPPFFTRQTNLTTHHSQLSKWAALVLAYSAHHRVFRLSLSAPATEDLFHNRRLNRRLGTADAREVLEFMRKEGRVEYISSAGGGGGGGGGGDTTEGGGGGDVVWVYWKTPEEWASLVEGWVDDTAQRGTVLTLYELTEGEGTRGTEFHGLDPEMLQKALQVLVKRGKAQIFGQEDQQGVKFF